MKKLFITLSLLFITVLGFSQTKIDFFKPNTKISWLGIDFSHVKLIGEFSQISGIGETSTSEVALRYFPAWNRLVLNEPSKYDLKGMLRKDNIYFDVDMIMKINADVVAYEDFNSYNTPNYKIEDIEKFVSNYSFEEKEGIAVLFVAECLNKREEIAYFHFVALNMKDKEILIHERVAGKPKGFGLRNYWGGSIFKVIKAIKKSHYNKWQSNS